VRRSPASAKILLVTEWIPLDELERLLAMVDVFEPLASPGELRVLSSGASLERLRTGETMMSAPESTPEG
jgi:hypothetical protein